MINVSKRIVAAGAVVVAAVAVSAQVASSWAELLPDGGHGVYCYANSPERSNPTRGHLTDIVTTGDQMTVTQTWEQWDSGQGRYITEGSEPVTATPTPPRAEP